MHDERFESQVNALKKQSRLKMKHYLVLPATAQRKVFGTDFPGSVNQIIAQAESLESSAIAEKDIEEMM